MSDVSLLNVRCTNLEVINYGSKGSGFLSRMFQHATSSSEKTSSDNRWISISQSKPFAMDGHAPDFNYDTVYTSEIFSELSLASGIYPSLVISIKCPMTMDCNIRLNVYIESVNLNGGNPIILAGCTFSRRDLLGFDESAGATFCCTMSSEFCVEAKTYIDILSPLEVVGMNNSICPFAPLRLTGSAGSESSLYFPPNATDNDEPPVAAAADDSSVNLTGNKDAKNSVSRNTTSLSPNPMAAQYVFYPDADESEEGTRLVPSVQMNEMIFEPKRITEIPVMIFENYADCLKRSLGAWRTRRQLESMRQGIFENREDANANGWHEIRVIVVEARMDPLPVPQRNAVLAPTRPYSIFEPIRGIMPEVQTETGDVESPKSSIRREIDGKKHGRSASAAHHSLSRAAQDSAVVNTRVRKQSSGLLSWVSSLTRPDVSRPSTYVSMSVHDAKHPFAFDIGRTNTEYYQYNPVYGSNVHADSVKAPISNATPSSRGNLETNNALYEFTRYDVSDSSAGESLDESESRALSKGETVRVQGTEVVFSRYIPPCDDSYLMLDLCLEPTKGSQHWDCKNAPPVIGTACILIGPNMVKDVWVPIETVSPQSSSGFPYVTGGWLHVEIVVNSAADRSPPKDASEFQTKTKNAAEAEVDAETLDKTDATNAATEAGTVADAEDVSRRSQLKSKSKFFRNIVAPASMPKCAAYKRQDNGVVVPLRVEDQTYLSDACARSQMPLGRDEDTMETLIADCYEWQWLCGFSGFDPLSVELTDADNSCSVLRQRADVSYPMEWIDRHIDALEHFMMESLDVLQCLRETHNHANGNCFRASCLKKDWQVQPLPTNFHMQMVTMRRMNNASSAAPKGSTATVFGELNPLAMGKSGGSSDRDRDRYMLRAVRSDRLIDSITCGCFTAHAMGHKKGGLDAQQRDLLAMRKRLDRVVQSYHDTVILPGGNDSVSRGGHKGGVRRLPTKGPEAALLAQVQEELLPYESAVVNVAKRRMLVMSQILTVAMNALLYKLSLVEEGYILGSCVDQWVRFGFPVVFESLLSVSGNERSMLEDTMSAVEMLQLYSFSICTATAPEATAHGHDGLKPHQRVRIIDPSTASVNLHGREVILTLPMPTVSKFSPSLQEAVLEGNAKIKLVPVLFTQGLDINQSIENVMGSSSRTESAEGAQLLSSVELEHFVNSNALEALNNYCHAVKPMSRTEIEDRTGSAAKEFVSMAGSSQLCHPWMERVAEHVRFTGKAEKNVAMLMEIQRACHALTGCKVTFCKSGKDRTGMVMSLEQSRILGERYDCGDTETRIIKDAELMRLHGPRLQVCTKNIGKPIYSINKLQAQFLPVTLRPPRSTMEEMSLFSKNDST